MARRYGDACRETPSAWNASSTHRRHRSSALIADAGKHSRFDGSGTVDHSAQESQPLSLGSKFGMSMRGRPETLFLPYRTTNTVIEFEPDRRIAWKTTIGPLGLFGGRIWRYELSPAEGQGHGTLVRETWDVSRTGSARCSRWARCPSRPRTACAPRWDASPRCWSPNRGAWCPWPVGGRPHGAPCDCR